MTTPALLHLVATHHTPCMLALEIVLSVGVDTRVCRTVSIETYKLLSQAR